MKKQRVHTIRELAEIAGVSHMTVSRVFRNHPSVKAETRERILALAKEYDFQPHPVLSMAMAIRANLRDQSSTPHATLAWVHSNKHEDTWQTLPHLKPYLDGVREHAAALGFGLDTFWIGKGGLSGKRFCDILTARGITGCIIAPPPGNLKHLHLRWDDFSWVTFHHDSWRPLLHRVATDANYSLGKTLRELRRLGYQRIGLAIAENLDVKSGFAYQGRYLVAKERYPSLTWCPPLFYPQSEICDAAPELRAWLKQYRPEVVVCNDVRARQMLESWGYDIPNDIGLVHLSMGPDTPHWSGMRLEGSQIGAACVDLLLSQMQQNKRGVPKAPYETLLRANWVKGETTRPHLSS
ncbi:MAG: LacI family DNA-binding transcriptional regulator [Verrucomicrobia bacterium]|nr:LacI family DNA-binding transcriptional regulator [Verrucomicrobiota bacterium]MCH8512539.1 LacI family transcriptional regulator [Kiritimatiellia bacterium]